ncbi:hypothetical protein GJ496_010602 [Pomphorhynchus laevis]|nr:hypothetical protein GJ496_010602 [Pomphorhynchus laevis]
MSELKRGDRKPYVYSELKLHDMVMVTEFENGFCYRKLVRKILQAMHEDLFCRMYDYLINYFSCQSSKIVKLQKDRLTEKYQHSLLHFQKLHHFLLVH